LNPAPAEEDLGKAYRDYFTHLDINAPRRRFAGSARAAIKRAYLAGARDQRQVSLRERMLGLFAYLDPTRRADTDFPLKYLSSIASPRILDLGCGRGDLLCQLRAFGWRAEGVEIDPIAAAVAQRKGFKIGVGSLHDQHFPDCWFDAVVMSHVIEHVTRPLELLTEVYRILQPGHPLIIATPNAGSLGHRMLGSRWPFLDPPRHVQLFTAAALESLARAARFGEVRICTEVRTAAAMLPLIGASRLAGKLFVYAESLALHFDRNAGEEITLCALR